MAPLPVRQGDSRELHGHIELPALALFAAVSLWVAGFDIAYALMDFGVDRAQGISSLPARFGEASGRILLVVLHACMLVLLGGAGLLAGAGALYYAGVAAAAILIFYEEYLFRSGANLFQINERIFLSNMAFSVVFLCTMAGGFA